MKLLDDAHLHDPATIAWKNMHALIENGASNADVDQAYRAYLAEVENQMDLKQKPSEKAA